MESSPERLLVAAALLAVIAAAAMGLRPVLRRWRGRRGASRASQADELLAAWRALEARAAALGHARAAGETPREWARRLEKELPAAPWRARLAELTRGYYRARFDPAADTAHVRGFISEARAALALLR